MQNTLISKQMNRLAAEMLPALDQEMRSVLQANPRVPALFYGMLHYHMGWVDAELRPTNVHSGKRIRPLLLLLTTAAAGGQWPQAVPAAAAIELVHNFSLIHDDIEDASLTRRGRPTVWKVWGMEQAINAGDAMFALSHLAMARLLDRGLPAETAVYALRRFDETCVQLTQGQFNDMHFETRPVVTPDEYIDMITGKTAVLVALCAELGAKIAGADGDTINHFASFAADLGLAFQIKDDILGIWGDETLTGKSAATDIATKKKTLPVLYGLTQSHELRTLYDQAAPDAAFVDAAIQLLDRHNARDYAGQKAAAYSESALAHLQAARPTGPAGEALYELADMLLSRHF